ncbi:CubicO group peptidase, beta-lactamase class C family [Alkalibacterium subtropicum]|uniref:CubicO group peptidase, beta-lactamase class C family n=1 Tax=Alkalibacterium subtropicum TaxID=753702 RepID=A0A1I1HKM3_9LACT|nr:serine hydrolase domain-containing protein [Alkalibacterium subtropicum]SFC24514.1 CubicO group peptidase, beta-lactamase class C family [Alkalibacterium subtropicum]
MDTTKIEKNFKKLTSSNKIFESVLMIGNASGDFNFTREYKRDIDTPMLMASTTKLLTTTCIYALVQEGKLNLKDELSNYLSKEEISGLHVFKGKEYTFELTIEHLLSQTSGLPDFYLTGTKPVFSKVKDRDFSYSFEEELEWIKHMKARFIPGTKRKAYYSDVNFDLLGKIIEAANASTLQEAYEKYIFSPLNLKHTYLANTESDFIPHTYYKDQRLYRPLFIRSCYASGGGVTTARELMIFIKAFWKGELFDKTFFSKQAQSNPLQMSFYPIHYMGGYMKITASYPFGKKYTLVGHSGSTGAFAFYCLEKDLFIVGDVSQIASPSTGVRLAMRTVLAAE